MRPPGKARSPPLSFDQRPVWELFFGPIIIMISARWWVRGSCKPVHFVKLDSPCSTLCIEGRRLSSLDSGCALGSVTAPLEEQLAGHYGESDLLLYGCLGPKRGLDEAKI